jgi:hypothetical protein
LLGPMTMVHGRTLWEMVTVGGGMEGRVFDARVGWFRRVEGRERRGWEVEEGKDVEADEGGEDEMGEGAQQERNRAEGEKRGKYEEEMQSVIKKINCAAEQIRAAASILSNDEEIADDRMKRAVDVINEAASVLSKNGEVKHDIIRSAVEMVNLAALMLVGKVEGGAVILRTGII